jgi:hypothetical protein
MPGIPPATYAAGQETAMPSPTAIQLPDGSRIEAIRLGDLRVPSYQRGLVASYRQIRNHYDQRLFDVLTVSHRGDHRHWIIDGLQRHTARTDLDGAGTLVFCRVLEGLDIAGEVELFEKLNRNRTRVSAFAILDAQREAGEEDAVALFRAVEATGLRIGPTHGAGVVGSPSQLRDIQDWDDGLGILRDSLDTAVAAWGKNAGSFHATVIGGLSIFYRWAREQGIRVPPVKLGAKLGQGKFAVMPPELINPGGMRGISSKSGGAGLAAARIALSWNAQRKATDNRLEIPEQWSAMAQTLRNR